MTARQSKKQRIELKNIAEREIHRFDDHGLWHKHVHNVELDPMQLLKIEEMQQFPNTIDFSSRRTGKTAVKELYLLWYNATHADQEGGIVAPKEAQALVNLGYHLDAIRRSDILSAYIEYKSGRAQLADTYYQFSNQSKARAYGIYSQIDGADTTWASLEEVDDMPAKRLFSNFLLTMGSNRRLGASQNSINNPQIRITGVYKGADTLAAMVKSGNYHILPTVDCYMGIELGILNEQFILQMRKQLSAEEFIRQLLCINIAAKNLIWERYIRLAMQKSLKIELEPAQPLPNTNYEKKGMISFGYDHSGHGENPNASKFSFAVLEQIGNFTILIFMKYWPPGTDDNVVMRDLLSFWRYFKPDYANGDAFGVGMLTSLNELLFAEGLTTIDRRTIGGGDSTKSTWPEWPFSPLQFEGMVKHQMAQALRLAIHNEQFILPYVDDKADSEPYILLYRQLKNMKAVAILTSYSSYKMIKPAVGDDGFDALIAANWAFVTRGVAQIVQSTIITRQQTPEQLLQSSSFVDAQGYTL